MAVQKATIKRELAIMCRTPVYQVYVMGIAQFLEHWQRKSPEEIQRLCLQLQQVIARSRSMAIEILGSRGVRFFERLIVEEVKWRYS